MARRSFPTLDIMSGALSVCQRLNVAPATPIPGSRVGIALQTLGRVPIHGLRTPLKGSLNGWFFWCGAEWSSDADFYDALCIEHIAEYLPQVIPYLHLPPGYRI